MNRFILDGVEYSYFHHPKNNTSVNERTVEIPVMRHHMEDRRGSMLEVGNVLSQYLGNRTWTTVDLIEKEDGVVNADILSWRGGRYNFIISISTFEHIGVDFGKDRFLAIKAIQHCFQELLLPGGRLVLTVPVGYNCILDSWLMTDWPGECSYLMRISTDNRWVQTDRETARKKNYGQPYKYGNAVIFGEYSRPN